MSRYFKNFPQVEYKFGNEVTNTDKKQLAQLSEDFFVNKG